MSDCAWSESPNHRPGEPLRTWLTPSDVVHHDAWSVVAISKSRDALARIIEGVDLSLEDQVALGRLNSFCVAQWYEPIVTMRPDAHIDPKLAAFFAPLVDSR